MQMSEIVASFRDAANKNKQIGILSDLNSCKPEDIMEILARHGAITGVKKKEPEKKEADKPKREKSTKWTPELDAEVSRLASEGLKITEIAERLGMNVQAIYDRRSALSKVPGVPKSGTRGTNAEKKQVTKKENTAGREDSLTTFTVFEKIVGLLAGAGWDVNCCNIDFLEKTVNIVAKIH